jgi:hypothetical protein
MAQSIEKQIRPLAAIEPKSHFVATGREMLRADVVPRSDDAALEEPECGFDGVSMNVTVNVHTETMIDRFMPTAHEIDFGRTFGKR